MNKILLFFLTAIFLVIVVSASLFFYNSFKVIEKEEIEMKLIITNNRDEVRLSNSTEFIDFGVLLSGSSSKAHLTLTNNHDKTILVTIKKSGEVSRFVEITQDEFLVEPNQTKWVLLKADVPEGVNVGEYKGMISIIQSRT